MNGDIEIPNDCPFANDKLNREVEVVKFVDFVSRYGDTGCTIALNGAWGCGKTTFVKMAMAYMKNNDYHPLYFNAWENDFLEEPLFALLAEMNNLFPTSDNKADLLGKAAQVLLLLGNDFIKQKRGVDVKELTESLQGNLAEYTKTIKAFDEFKNALSEYVANNTTNTEKPVVFFIDELDRCNPNYAIKVLERVKHLFEVPNVIFVLSINKDILNHAVRAYYGNSDMDANNYLRRFIDIEYDMPVNKMEDYSSYLYKQYGFDDYEKTSSNRSYDGQLHYRNFQDMLYLLCTHSNLDLRTMNKLHVQLISALRILRDRQKIDLKLVLLLCYLKVVHRSVYDGIKAKSLSGDELFAKLCLFYEQDFDVIITKHNFHRLLAYSSVELLYIYLCSCNERQKVETREAPENKYFEGNDMPRIWKDVCSGGGLLNDLNDFLGVVDFKN